MLTVKTEVNGDGTQREQMKGVLPWLVRWACRDGTREFCSASAALNGPVQNIFPHRTLFQFLCPNRPADGHGQAAVLGRLSLSMSPIKIDLLSNIQKARRRQAMRAEGRWAAAGPEEEGQGLAGGSRSACLKGGKGG